MKCRLTFAAMLAAAATAALAQTNPPTTLGPSPAPAVLEADAAAALDRMGAYLRTLKTFEVHADGTIERVFEGGHKLQFQQDTRYTVQQPDRMTVDIQTDHTHRRVYYNGKVMTVVAMNAGRYTSFPVNGTLSEVLSRAYDQYGLEFPLQDLFRWGSPTATAALPVAGFRVGPSQIGDQQTTHYFFSQDGVDFQLWIADGERPLPVLMVITGTDDAARPQYAAIFRWNLAPQASAADFTFKPGPNQQLVDFGAAKAVAAQ